MRPKTLVGTVSQDFANLQRFIGKGCVRRGGVPPVLACKPTRKPREKNIHHDRTLFGSKDGADAASARPDSAEETARKLHGSSESTARLPGADDVVHSGPSARPPGAAWHS
jgi:hypothetical protein